MHEQNRLIGMGVETAVVLVLFAVMVMIGPFGTFQELTLTERMQYWGFITIVNWLQLRLIQAGLASWFGWERFWTITLGACFLAAVPATLEVIWLEGYFRGDSGHQPGFLWLYPQVLVLSAAIMVPVSRYFLRESPVSEPDAQPSPPSQAGQRPGDAFFRRIPIAIGRDLHAVQAEDHYIRIYTARGDDLILHRFSDALTELEDVGGLQVHRSWWVSETGIAEAIRRDRKVFLKLKNGAEAPVSRTYMAAVREKGWLS